MYPLRIQRLYIRFRRPGRQPPHPGSYRYQSARFRGASAAHDVFIPRSSEEHLAGVICYLLANSLLRGCLLTSQPYLAVVSVWRNSDVVDCWREIAISPNDPGGTFRPRPGGGRSECKRLFSSICLDREMLYLENLTMLGALKFFGLLLVNIIVAVIGTAILTTAIGKAFHAHSLGAILWREWSLSIGCAAAMGFGMWHTWRSDVAFWTWVLPAVWFGAKFMLAIGQGSLLFQFSGEACANGVRPIGCINFFAFTIPFIRSVFYSIGAYASSVVHEVRHPENAAMRPSNGANC